MTDFASILYPSTPASPPQPPPTFPLAVSAKPQLPQGASPENSRPAKLPLLKGWTLIGKDPVAPPDPGPTSTQDAAAQGPTSSQDMASRLYSGNPTSQAPPTLPSVAPAKPQAPQAPSPEDALAAKLYPEGPPAEYAFSVPTGYEHLGLEHDEAAFQAFVPVARNMGLTQAQAQELLNLHIVQTYGKKR